MTPSSGTTVRCKKPSLPHSLTATFDNSGNCTNVYIVDKEILHSEIPMLFSKLEYVLTQEFKNTDPEDLIKAHLTTMAGQLKSIDYKQPSFDIWFNLKDGELSIIDNLDCEYVGGRILALFGGVFDWDSDGKHFVRTGMSLNTPPYKNMTLFSLDQVVEFLNNYVGVGVNIQSIIKSIPLSYFIHAVDVSNEVLGVRDDGAVVVVKLPEPVPENMLVATASKSKYLCYQPPQQKTTEVVHQHKVGLLSIALIVATTLIITWRSK